MADFNFIFTGLGIKQLETDDEFQFEEYAGQDSAIAFSDQLGTPVYSNIVFKAGSYTERGQEVSYDGLQIDSVLITINQTKQIIKTQVQGRRGSVKEYISEGDYVINVKGAIVSPDYEIYPAADVNTFVELMKVPTALKFTSEFLTRFGAFDVVVDSYSLPQTKGFRNVQGFNLNLISDNPVEIRLNEEQKIEDTTG